MTRILLPEEKQAEMIENKAFGTTVDCSVEMSQRCRYDVISAYLSKLAHHAPHHE
jgi:hypothetical protein